MSNLFGLFSKKKTQSKIEYEEEQRKNEHKEKVRTIVKLLDLDELLQLSLDLVRKEPDLRVIGGGGNWGEYTQIFEPLRKNHFEDLLLESIGYGLITYEHLQDYLIQHVLLPRDYFPDRVKLDTGGIVLGFAKSVKIESLKKHDTKCARCRRFSPPFLFDHNDDNQTNNTLDNCIPLCRLCYKRKYAIRN